MADTLIDIRSLVKRFDDFEVVSGISFTVKKGEVLGFLGPNGAGKSTTMKMITGFLPPTSGEVSICGHDVLEDPISAQRKIGYLPEGAPAYADMTPLQFLQFIADVRGLSGAAKKDAIDRSIERGQLQDVLYQPIETLSKGFNRRVGLAQALLHDPDVLIMDEPTDGLDPNQKSAVRDLITQMAPDKAIVISTHILEEVDAVCSRALIIDRGRVVADGTPDEMAKKSRYHNAVRLRMVQGQADEARPKLRELKGVDALDETIHGDSVEFRLVPANDADLIKEVSGLISSNSWKVQKLTVDEGRLEDVFRSVTTSDAVLLSQEHTIQEETSQVKVDLNKTDPDDAYRRERDSLKNKAQDNGVGGASSDVDTSATDVKSGSDPTDKVQSASKVDSTKAEQVSGEK